MSKKVCQHCGKGKLKGHKVSHAKQRTIRFSKPNLHWQRVVIDGLKKRLLLCTKCTRQLKRKAKEQEAKKAEKKTFKTSKKTA